MKTFQVKFTAKNLTGNAGLVHLGKFAEKLRLPQALKKAISIERGPTANYDVANVIMMLIMGVLGFRQTYQSHFYLTPRFRHA